MGIKKNVILGFNTQIGSNCNITKSVIGSNCVIGNKCCISNSYLFGDCTIGNNTKLNGAVIANNVIIGSHCSLTKGCILSFGVHLDDNIHLKQYTKLSLDKHENEFDVDDDFLFDNEEIDPLPKQKYNKKSPKSRTLSSSSSNYNNETNNDSPKSTIMGILDKDQMDQLNIDENNDENKNNDNDDDNKYDTKYVGVNGKGYLYEIDVSDDSFVMDKINNVLAAVSDLPNREVINDSMLSTTYSNFSDQHPMMIPDDAPIGNGQIEALNANKVISEIADCIENAENNKATGMSDVIFEVCTSVRLSNNCTLKDFAYSVFKAIVNRISENESVENKTEKMANYIEKYGCLFERLAKKEGDQLNVIDGLYKSCNTRTKGLIIFFLEALDKLFFADIVALDVIQKWNKKRTKTNVSTFENFLEHYIGEWVEAEEEDDDDDDDDDDEDEEEGDDSFSQSLSI